MLLDNLVTRRVSEENASKSSLTRRVTKQGHLLLAALSRARRLRRILTIKTWHMPASWHGADI